MSPDPEQLRAARAVCRVLADAGYQVVFAGGAVRDALLGREGGDIDVATAATPAQVQRLFDRTVAVGASFGVVKVLWGEHAFDVATFRQDLGVGDGRHPAAVAPATLEQDVQRRDFTINGLVQDPFDGEVIDLVGGRDDLRAGLVRAIGDPDLRFEEDALRLLRAVRFASVLRFELEPATREAVRRGAARVRGVSGERVRDELSRMLVPSTRRRALELLEETGLLEQILPEVAAMRGVEQPPEFHPEGDVWIHTRLAMEALEADGEGPVPFELALGTLLHDVGKPPTFERASDRIRFTGHVEQGAAMAEAICERLRLSRRATGTVVALVAEHLRFADVPRMRVATLRRFLSSDHFPLLLRLYRADCAASHGLTEALPVIEAMRARIEEEAMMPTPWLRGADVLAAGVAPGPRVGRLLAEALDLQLEGGLPDRDAALSWLARRAAHEGG